MKEKCNRFDVLITSYIDGELGPSEKAEVRIHLDECQGCNEKYMHEREIKKLVKERLPQVKAPAYLQNRIRRNLIRNGYRPSFLQLMQSLFQYRPVITSFALALIAFFMFLPMLQTQQSPFHFSAKSSENTELRGEIICLDCEFRSQSGVNPAHDSSHRHGLKAEDETIWTFVSESSKHELIKDEKLLKKKALVSGIIFRNSQYIYVKDYTLL